MKLKSSWFVLVLNICIVVFCLAFANTVSYADETETWQSQLKAKGFDIVDTFDKYDDWTANLEAPPSYTENGEKKEAIWKAYEDNTHYNRCPGIFTYHKTIGDHGSDKQIGSKGLRVHHSRGVSYFGFYFGDGSARSGRKELYVFFRVYFPVNSHPTHVPFPLRKACDNDLYNYVSYREGENYEYTTAGKFFNINVGLRSYENGSWDDTIPYTNDGGSYQYGCSECWWAIYGKPYTQNFRTHLGTKKSGAWGEYDISEYVTIERSKYLNKLIGIEYYFKINDPADQSNGIAKMWIYDENGDPTLLLEENDVKFRNKEHCDGHLFNRVRFEGNKHMIRPVFPGMYIYRTDDTMDGYYIDDFILDDQRIGPIYYSITEQESVSSPRNLRIETR